jgi:prevent-host-death family protein
MSMTKRTVAAGAFKQGCLAILDEVADGNIEIIVTKRGRPVARLVPIADPQDIEKATLARMRGRVAGAVGREADLLRPTSSLARWSLLPGGKRR